jgi:hypothetical protein
MWQQGRLLSQVVLRVARGVARGKDALGHVSVSSGFFSELSSFSAMSPPNAVLDGVCVQASCGAQQSDTLNQACKLLTAQASTCMQHRSLPLPCERPFPQEHGRQVRWSSKECTWPGEWPGIK